MYFVFSSEHKIAGNHLLKLSHLDLKEMGIKYVSIYNSNVRTFDFLRT